MTIQILEDAAMTNLSDSHPLLLFERYTNFTPPPPYLAATSRSSNHQCLALASPPDSVGHHTAASPKTKLHRRTDTDAATAAAPIPPCIECGKRFSSSKALYGHMRCHPERPYRGMNPRAHFGRPLLLGSPAAECEFTDDEYEVARSLLMLASGPQAVHWPPPGSPFACRSCPRVFGSHQALARHRSSHRARAGGKEMGGGGGGGQYAGKKRAWEEAVVFARTVGSCSSSNCCVWDLNLPPPLDEGSPVNNPSPALDLKLGI